jgi:type II secretory pathway pseudopilin PulG
LGNNGYRIPQAVRGFTLLELVVVMFILMALAAIIVPLFPSMVERAHRASQATNESEITKAVQLYQGLYGNLSRRLRPADRRHRHHQLPAANNTASPMVYGETPGTYAGGNVASPTFTTRAGATFTRGIDGRRTGCPERCRYQ